MNRLRRTSLASRIVLATVSVALLAAVATAVVAFQLVRQVTIEQSREVLRSTTRVVAATPAKERATIVRNLDRADAGRIHLVLVRATGATVPLGDTTVPASALKRVESTGRVSERVTSGGTTLLIEGTKLSAGDTVIATQNFSLVQSATAKLLWRFALATGLGLVVAVGVGILVARLVTRPLRGAAHSARLLAAGRRGVIPSAATEGVAEIVDIEQALAGLDAALATSESRQHEFLLSISHEIRTPLTAIRGYAGALSDGLVPPEALPTIGRTLVAETGRLDAFTRDLLELARLEADDFTIRPERLDLVELARDSLQAWEARAAGLEVAVVLDPAAPVIPFVSDPMRVRQLLDGLLENALRASPAGTTITLAVSAGAQAAPAVPAAPAAPTAPGAQAAPGSPGQPPAVVARVRDQGPGLSANDAADAFERGLLADRYRAERPVGTGLGLSIASRLVRRLGGTIGVNRPAAGGAEFVVTLPVEPAVRGGGDGPDESGDRSRS